jgi:hypothetical protein
MLKYTITLLILPAYELVSCSEGSENKTLRKTSETNGKMCIMSVKFYILHVTSIDSTELRRNRHVDKCWTKI